MTKRLLFVSIAFPPKGDPECIQAARYYYYMSRTNELNIDVVTSKSPTLFMPVDLSMSKYSHVKGQLIEIPVVETLYSNFLLRKLLPSILNKPDSKMTFHWQWKRVIQQLKIKPNVIYSRSNPLSSTVMGYELATYFNVPWVLHLSDPWTENVLYNYSASTITYHTTMEFECFRLASLISFTSEKTRQLYQRKYPDMADKMTVFPNVYDPEFTASSPGSRHDQSKVKIVYTGGLANTRSAQPFLDALEMVLKSSPGLAEKIEIVFAGDMDRQNRALFNKNTNSCLRHLGIVSLEYANQLQQSADLLIVIDSIIQLEERAVFFPSKLLDYAVLEKPILAITDDYSATSEFVAKHGGVHFPHSSVRELSIWLENFIAGKIRLLARKPDVYFSAEYQAAKLTEAILGL